MEDTSTKRETSTSSSTTLIDPLDNRTTPFEKRVYSTTQKCIPSGKVASYGLIASTLHTSARSVGGAMKRNPYAPLVP